MIIVGGVFAVEPGEQDAFLSGHLELMRQSRAEAGCLEYTFSADPLDPGRILLFERWTDQESLDAHSAVRRAAPRPADDEVKPQSVSITIYDVAGERAFGA